MTATSRKIAASGITELPNVSAGLPRLWEDTAPGESRGQHQPTLKQLTLAPILVHRTRS